MNLRENLDLKNKSKKSVVTIFHSEFREDLSYWIKIDRKVALKVLELVEAIVRDPFEGIGKPDGGVTVERQWGGAGWIQRFAVPLGQR